LPVEEDVMAEQKKGGFHALEERIHQMEQEDAKKEREATSERQRGAGKEGKAKSEGGGTPPAERK
jgi:hypothetical protein